MSDVESYDNFDDKPQVYTARNIMMESENKEVGRDMIQNELDEAVGFKSPDKSPKTSRLPFSGRSMLLQDNAFGTSQRDLI